MIERTLWSAVSIMMDLYPDTADNICFSGGSLGGGTGLMAIPWDNRIRAGHISVPTLGNPFQLQFPLPGNEPGATRRDRALADPAATANDQELEKEIEEIKKQMFLL